MTRDEARRIAANIAKLPGVAKPSKILTWPAPLVCRLNPADDARTVAHLKVATNKQLLGRFLIIATGDDLWWSRDAIAGERRVNSIICQGVSISTVQNRHRA